MTIEGALETFGTRGRQTSQRGWIEGREAKAGGNSLIIGGFDTNFLIPAQCSLKGRVSAGAFRRCIVGVAGYSRRLQTGGVQRGNARGNVLPLEKTKAESSSQIGRVPVFVKKTPGKKGT